MSLSLHCFIGVLCYQLAYFFEKNKEVGKSVLVAHGNGQTSLGLKTTTTAHS